MRLPNERSGLRTGLKRVGAFTTPAINAHSSMFMSLGFLSKKVLAAALIPKALCPKNTVFRYIAMISSLE